MQTNNPVLALREGRRPGIRVRRDRSAYTQASGQAPRQRLPLRLRVHRDSGRIRHATDQHRRRIPGSHRRRQGAGHPNDVVVKSAIMFGLVVLFAFIGWNVITAAPGLMFPIFIVAIVLGFVNALKKNVSPVLMMVFAVAEGLMLGGISNWYNSYAVANGWDSGIVIQAVVATMTTFGVMLTLYLTGIIKVTKRFTQVLMVAAVSYRSRLASFVAAIFGVGGGWGFYGVGGLGIIICLAGVGIAAFFLVLDFEAIKQGVAMGLPERESGGCPSVCSSRLCGSTLSSCDSSQSCRVATSSHPSDYGSDFRRSIKYCATAASSDAAVVDFQ